MSDRPQPVDDLPVEERPEGQVLVVGADAEGPDPGVISCCARQQRVPAERQEPARADPPHQPVDVGKGQAHRYRHAVVGLQPERPVRVDDLLELLGQVPDLGFWHGRETPVVAPRRVVHLEEAADLGVEVVHVRCRGRRPGPAAGCGRGSAVGDRRAPCALSKCQAHRSMAGSQPCSTHSLRSSGGFWRVRSAGGSSKPSTCRPSSSLVVKQAGPTHDSAPRPAAQAQAVVEQGAGRLRVVEGVEEADPSPAHLLVVVEERVDAGADAAHRAPVPVGHPQGHLLVGHGRVLGRKPVVDAQAQRGDPPRVAAVDAERHIDEPAPAEQPGRAHLEAGHRGDGS